MLAAPRKLTVVCDQLANREERDNHGAYISSFVGMRKCGFGGNHILGYRAHRIIYFTYSVQVC